MKQQGNVVVISCSLHPQSRSYVLAQQVVNELQGHDVGVQLFDLRTLDLPFCDAVSAHKTADAVTVVEAIRAARAVLLTMPVYNYDVNAAAKNLLELGLKAWNHKLVGFLCAAGGRNSYMSVMGLAGSLMLDFRCIIIPRFVYATGADFADDRQPTMRIESPVIHERIAELAETTVRLAAALEPVYGVAVS